MTADVLMRCVVCGVDCLGPPPSDGFGRNAETGEIAPGDPTTRYAFNDGAVAGACDAHAEDESVTAVRVLQGCGVVTLERI